MTNVHWAGHEPVQRDKHRKTIFVIGYWGFLGHWLSTANCSGISKTGGEPNPKGIPQQSPGLRGTSYPGIRRRIDDNPERVAAHGNGSATRPQPRWGCETPATFTQGSSSLATLGFVAESLDRKSVV